MLLNAIKPKPNSFDMSCSNVHINWTNIYSILTKRRHFFWREQSLLSKSYAALGWPLQCWREMSGQELGRIIPSLPSFHGMSLYKYDFWTSRTDSTRRTQKTNRGKRYLGGNWIQQKRGNLRCLRKVYRSKGRVRAPGIQALLLHVLPPPHAGNGSILTLMTQSSLATIMFPASHSPAEGTTPTGIRRPWFTNDKLCDYR